MSLQPQRYFANVLTTRPQPKNIDVTCKLQHFALITYAITPEKFKSIIPKRFKLDTIFYQGKEYALMSVVPFIDVDFTSAVYPFPKFTMGQTNYRVYVIDQMTGERCVWFIGTTLDSWTIMIPRYVWVLPWYSGKIEFDCVYDSAKQRYHHYHMTTLSNWAAAAVQLSQSGAEQWNYEGFPDLESFQVYLTHPLAGFYHRRDGKLGVYRVWHDRLNPIPAKLEYARFELLDRLGLVSFSDQLQPYSTLIEPMNEFTIYLPPRILD